MRLNRPPLLRRLIAAALATFSLVFAGCGAVVADAVAYAGAQVAGATAGAFLLLAAWPDGPAHLGATAPSVGWGAALRYEVVPTAILMFVIMAVATDTRAQGVAGPIAGAALGALACQLVRGSSRAPMEPLPEQASVGETDG